MDILGTVIIQIYHHIVIGQRRSSALVPTHVTGTLLWSAPSMTSELTTYNIYLAEVHGVCRMEFLEETENGFTLDIEMTKIHFNHGHF